MKTNIPKLEEMVHYIIHSVCNKPNVGKTVLWKLMYFTDFNYFELFEKTLTGEEYRKLDHGPAPSHFDRVIENLKEQGKIKAVRARYHKKLQDRFISIINPDVSLLSKKEILNIEDTIKRYSNMNATQISELSHLDIPWKATEDKQIIDYTLVFYREPLTSVREYDDDDCN